MPKKYALKHFLFVGIVGGFIIAQILTVIINQPIGMFLYRNASSPVGNISNDIILTIISILIILFSIYISNILFAKITKTKSIPKEQITKSTIFFGIFVLTFLTITNNIPLMLDVYISYLSSGYKTAYPVIATIPIYFLMYLIKITIIILGFSLISRKYFVRNEFYYI